MPALAARRASRARSLDGVAARPARRRALRRRRDGAAASSSASCSPPTTQGALDVGARRAVDGDALPLADAATARRSTCSSARSPSSAGVVPDGPPVAQAGPLPARSRGRARRLAAAPGADPAGRHRLLPRRGRGGPRGRRRPGARRHHRARPLPLPVPRRDGLPPRDLARLPAPRRRARAGRRARHAHASTTPRPLAGDTTIGHAHRLLPGRSRRSPARACPPRAPGAARRSRSSWSGSPTTPATSARWPATSASCPTASYCGRHPRRLPEPDRAALRQPLRPRPGAARAASASTSTRRARPNCCERLDARATRRRRAPSTCSGTRPRCMARFEDTGRGRRARSRASSAWSARPRAPAGSRATSAHDHPVRHLPLRPHPGLDLATRGDVFARAYVRWLEIQRSVGVRPRAARRAAAAARSRAAAGALRARSASRSSLVEGWRGEICHVGADRRRRPLRRATRSSTRRSTTGSGLALALRDQQISDFPLCNKSFNLSYCGHDL